MVGLIWTITSHHGYIVEPHRTSLPNKISTETLIYLIYSDLFCWVYVLRYLISVITSPHYDKGQGSPIWFFLLCWCIITSRPPPTHILFVELCWQNTQLLIRRPWIHAPMCLGGGTEREGDRARHTHTYLGISSQLVRQRTGRCWSRHQRHG